MAMNDFPELSVTAMTPAIRSVYKAKKLTEESLHYYVFAYAHTFRTIRDRRGEERRGQGGQ